ncbi:hypothetical protein ABZ858_19115 [Streptomyces sp. NPDC047017]|uniref:hypothetical protein n=1 Tax=Streptomyces sp. NPDC047017 TaxID=3155024 RepID=UPI0033F9752F
MPRARMTVAAAALAGMLLAGCGKGDGGSSGAGEGRQGAGAGGSAAPVKLSVPPAYDGAKGWDQEIGWVPRDADADPVATDGKTVAYIIRSGDGYAVQARDGATGKVRWTSAPYRTPPAEDRHAQWAMLTPRLTAVRQGGRTYFAAWAVGEQPGDALTKSQEVTQIGIYPADASGGSVEPLHDLSVPDDGLRSGLIRVRDSGAGLLITWETADEHSVAVDAVTGAVKRYDDANGLPGCSDCWDSAVVAVTTKGPVVSGRPGGLTVPGGWTGKDIAPKNVKDGETGTLTGVNDGVFVARWRQATDTDGTDAPVWSVHDLESGRLLVGAECDNGRDDDDARTLVRSPNGTYAAFGSVVFDVKAGRTLCLTGEGNRRTIEVVALADDGTAYGVTGTDISAEVSTRPAVEVNVGTGSPRALPEGTLAPFATLPGGAVFTQRENGAGMRLSVRRKR